MNSFERIDRNGATNQILSTTIWSVKRLWRSGAHFLTHKRVFLRTLLFYFILLPVILWMLLGHIAPFSQVTFPPQLRNAKRIMLVVAHPDDESLFFSPTILHMTKRRPEVAMAILVMSAGTCYLLSCFGTALIKGFGANFGMFVRQSLRLGWRA